MHVGASTLTIRALAVANKDLASLLLKQGFTQTTVKVGKQTVEAFEKTVRIHY